MTQFLIKRFIQNHEKTHETSVRASYGKLAGIVGTLSNLLLFIAKLAGGIMSNSISIMTDAMNNLSDFAASVITLFGFKLSEIPADEEHPYGHTRYEYISGLLISCIIIIISFQFFISSFQKILNPAAIHYSISFWIILIVSILIKIWQGRFYAKIGKIISSSSLTVASTDSRNDVITTSIVVVSAIIARLTGWMIDGYMGVLVSVFLLYSGIKLIKETLSPLLGEAPNHSLVEDVRKRIMSYESVIGLHDLMIHDYGPKKQFASVHVEFPAEQDILLSHDIIDSIERDFASELQISLVIHLDPVITNDPRLDTLKIKLQAIAQSIHSELDIHDFRMVEGLKHKNLIFDVVVPPGLDLDNASLRGQITEEVKKIRGNYLCVITIDRNYIASVQTKHN